MRSIGAEASSPWPLSVIRALPAGTIFPPLAEGHDVAESSEKFAALYRLLANHNVRIAMAGDTHDFEYYREKNRSDNRDYGIGRASI